MTYNERLQVVRQYDYRSVMEELIRGEHPWVALETIDSMEAPQVTYMAGLLWSNFEHDLLKESIPRLDLPTPEQRLLDLMDRLAQPLDDTVALGVAAMLLEEKSGREVLAFACKLYASHGFVVASFCLGVLTSALITREVNGAAKDAADRA